MKIELARKELHWKLQCWNSWWKCICRDKEGIASFSCFSYSATLLNLTKHCAVAWKTTYNFSNNMVCTSWNRQLLTYCSNCLVPNYTAWKTSSPCEAVCKFYQPNAPLTLLHYCQAVLMELHQRWILSHVLFIQCIVY